MIRTIVILLLFGCFARVQANCEENRYVNVPNFRIRVLGLEGEALKSLPLSFHMATAESKDLAPVHVAIDFDEATYEYIVRRQIVQVPNTVLPDQIICSQTPKSLSIVVENYKPLKNLEILDDKQEHFSVLKSRSTIELKLKDAETIVKVGVAQAF